MIQAFIRSFGRSFGLHCSGRDRLVPWSTTGLRSPCLNQFDDLEVLSTSLPIMGSHFHPQPHPILWLINHVLGLQGPYRQMAATTEKHPHLPKRSHLLEPTDHCLIAEVPLMFKSYLNLD